MSAAHKHTHHHKKRTRISLHVRLALFAVAFLCFALAIGQLIRNGFFDGLLGIQTSTAVYPSPIAIPVDEHDYSLGEFDAPITIVIFSDYQCQYCGALEGFRMDVIDELKKGGFWKEDDEPLFPKLQEEYIDTGLVRLVHKDFPLLGIASLYMAAAAKCAADQGKYWEYHNALFENQGMTEGGGLNSFLVTLGEKVGVKKDLFGTCIDSDQYLPQIKAKEEEARKLGITQTPTIYINGIALPGTQPYRVVKELIEHLRD